MEYLLLIGRILFGWEFILNGYRHLTRSGPMAQYAGNMGVPAPRLAVIVTGLMILLGGLSVLLGVYARIGAILIFLFLVPVAFVMHRYWDVSDPMMRANQDAHFWKNLALAGAALIITFFGSGVFSLVE